ncbi:hypothetical protein GCM10010145_25030 [Streptomyces ruber]|uniref:Uncharacterized protein n=2 Tax=Streptomyces TaxID=1883 RepID=A0A918BAX4_9ACTN|nr:hypothetical protein GCM10010145_25030 [Streptomyces ruber]
MARTFLLPDPRDRGKAAASPVVPVRDDGAPHIGLVRRAQDTHRYDVQTYGRALLRPRRRRWRKRWRNRRGGT